MTYFGTSLKYLAIGFDVEVCADTANASATSRQRPQPGWDEIVERAHQAGVEIVTAPAQQPWGSAGAFADPDGHSWMVSSGPFPSED